VASDCNIESDLSLIYKLDDTIRGNLVCVQVRSKTKGVPLMLHEVLLFLKYANEEWGARSSVIHNRSVLNGTMRAVDFLIQTKISMIFICLKQFLILENVLKNTRPNMGYLDRFSLVGHVIQDVRLMNLTIISI